MFYSFFICAYYLAVYKCISFVSVMPLISSHSCFVLICLGLIVCSIGLLLLLFLVWFVFDSFLSFVCFSSIVFCLFALCFLFHFFNCFSMFSGALFIL